MLTRLFWGSLSLKGKKITKHRVFYNRKKHKKASLFLKRLSASCETEGNASTRILPGGLYYLDAC